MGKVEWRRAGRGGAHLRATGSSFSAPVESDGSVSATSWRSSKVLLPNRMKRQRKELLSPSRRLRKEVEGRGERVGNLGAWHVCAGDGTLKQVVVGCCVSLTPHLTGLL